MQSVTISARKRALARVLVLGVAGVAGVFTGWSVAAQTADLTPAQVVNFRFPPNWTVAAAAARPEAASANRTADSRSAAPKGDRQLAGVIFNPNPTYELASADGGSRRVDLRADLRADLPVQVAAYADPATDGASAAPARAAVERPAVAAPPPRPAKQSNAVLNDAQIASIKSRLQLKPEQERHWPAVAAALRNITHKKTAVRAGVTGGNRALSIDPSSPEVAQLKSAAIPLVLSLSFEQKREVKQLAHVMGLESVISQF